MARRASEAYRIKRSLRERRHPELRAASSSLVAGKQHSLIQASVINRIADSAERIQPFLAFIEELSNRLFDQFIGAAISSASEFLLDLVSQNQLETLRS